MNKPAVKFKLSVSIIKEGRAYIAYTPALDLSSTGKTIKEAKKRFGEAVVIFFEELAKKGTLEKVLLDLGWRKADSAWNPPMVVSSDVQTFCVAV